MKDIGSNTPMGLVNSFNISISKHLLLVKSNRLNMLYKLLFYDFTIESQQIENGEGKSNSNFSSKYFSFF